MEHLSTSLLLCLFHCQNEKVADVVACLQLQPHPQQQQQQQRSLSISSVQHRQQQQQQLQLALQQLKQQNHSRHLLGKYYYYY